MSSLTKIVSLSREQLHAMVWREPMTKVAARFGITDVALRKKCVRHAVPVPGRGFWQQRDAGRSPTPIALPRNAGTGSIEFCLQGDADAILSSHEAALSKGPLTSVAVRTRADHSAEAQQRMEAKAHRLEAVEREEREARTRAAEERKAVESWRQMRWLGSALSDFVPISPPWLQVPRRKGQHVIVQPGSIGRRGRRTRSIRFVRPEATLLSRTAKHFGRFINRSVKSRSFAGSPQACRSGCLGRSLRFARY
jgi:hypothetical protein